MQRHGNKRTPAGEISNFVYQTSNLQHVDQNLKRPEHTVARQKQTVWNHHLVHPLIVPPWDSLPPPRLRQIPMKSSDDVSCDIFPGCQSLKKYSLRTEDDM